MQQASGVRRDVGRGRGGGQEQDHTSQQSSAVVPAAARAVCCAPHSAAARVGSCECAHTGPSAGHRRTADRLAQLERARGSQSMLLKCPLTFGMAGRCPNGASPRLWRVNAARRTPPLLSSQYYSRNMQQYSYSVPFLNTRLAYFLASPSGSGGQSATRRIAQQRPFWARARCVRTRQSTDSLSPLASVCNSAFVSSRRGFGQSLSASSSQRRAARSQNRTRRARHASWRWQGRTECATGQLKSAYVSVESISSPDAGPYSRAHIVCTLAGYAASCS